MYRLRIDFSDQISPLKGYVLIKNCEISCRISASRSCEKQLTEVSPRQISRGTYVSRVGTPRHINNTSRTVPFFRCSGSINLAGNIYSYTSMEFFLLIRRQ